MERPLGNTMGHSLLSFLIFPAAQNPRSAWGIPKKLPLCERSVPPPFADASSTLRNAPSTAFHIASKQACLLTQQSQAPSWRGDLPGPLLLPCPSASGVQAHNRGLVPTPQAWGPLGGMSFLLRLLQPQACFQMVST